MNITVRIGELMQDQLNEIKDDVKSILKLLNGNGKIGFIAKCQMVYDWMLQVKSDKGNIVMFAYRVMLALILGFIAVKVGLK